MRRMLSLGLVLLMILVVFSAQAENGNAGAVSITGKVAEIEKYGHARLDVTIEDFNSAGFTLGDIVTVTAGSYSGDMPYFNGYYIDRGEYMVRAYPGHTNIAVCINYGKFAETAGVGVGDPVTITLKEKGGALFVQEINNLVYTDERADYASDVVFANFRAVLDGKLYRSATPVNNSRGRAAFADALISEAGIKTVMNLINTDAELAGGFASQEFSSPYYKSLYEAGQVIALGLPADYAADVFADGVVKGLTFLSENEMPYLVHCTEGKERTGFTCMLIEALMGMSKEEIVADYMISYANYYGIEAGTDRYEMIAEKNIREMMRTVAGLEKGASLEDTDIQAAAEAYLLNHGMTEAALRTLQEKLK